MDDNKEKNWMEAHPEVVSDLEKILIRRGFESPQLTIKEAVEKAFAKNANLDPHSADFIRDVNMRVAMSAMEGPPTLSR